MSANCVIYIKGIQKQIFVTKAELDKIIEIRDDKSIPFDFIIHLGKIHFQKGDIKFLEENNDADRKESNEKDMKAFYEEERKNRTKETETARGRGQRVINETQEEVIPEFQNTKLDENNDENSELVNEMLVLSGLSV